MRFTMALATSAPTYVFPVPGGPWMRLTRLERAWLSASFWVGSRLAWLAISWVDKGGSVDVVGTRADQIKQMI